MRQKIREMFGFNWMLWRGPHDKVNVNESIWRLRWPSYSPDLTPSDFLVWGCLKCKAYAACAGCNQEVPVNCTKGTVTNIDAVLHRITQNCLRLHQCITSRGGHHKWSSKSVERILIWNHYASYCLQMFRSIYCPVSHSDWAFTVRTA
jgi:hypothetical protein